MVSTLFITLPVDSTLRSRRFFESLGFRPDEVFCDAGTLCLPISDGTVLVLLATQRFAGYSAGEAAVDPRRGDAAVREVVIAFSAASRHEVDEIADAALANGRFDAARSHRRGFHLQPHLLRSRRARLGDRVDGPRRHSPDIEVSAGIDVSRRRRGDQSDGGEPPTSWAAVGFAQCQGLGCTCGGAS